MYFLPWCECSKIIALSQFFPGHGLPQSAERSLLQSVGELWPVYMHWPSANSSKETGAILAQGQRSRGWFGTAEFVVCQILPVRPS